MKSKTSFIIIVLFSISIGAIIGFYGGTQFTKKRLDNYFSQIHFKGVATELKTYVRVLELLQKKDVGAGVERLEKYVDVNLDSLSLYDNIPATERNEEIIATIREVKAYREKYSKHTVNPAFSNSVQRALDLATEK